MKKDNEQYKRMIRIFLVVILVACETSLFMYSWIKNYNLYTVFPFFQKGHWMMGGDVCPVSDDLPVHIWWTESRLFKESKYYLFTDFGVNMCEHCYVLADCVIICSFCKYSAFVKSYRLRYSNCGNCCMG